MHDHDDDRRNTAASSMGALEAEAPPQRPVAGSWVRFIGEGKLGRDHIVLEGMLGQAKSEPCHEGGCGPYTHIKPVGARSGLSYPNDWFEIVTDTPSAEAIETTRRLYLGRAQELQARRGWMGLLQIGRRIMDEDHARRELEMQCDRVVRFAREGKHKEVRGTLRRISRVLEAFGLHPCGASAIELARAVQEQRNDIVQAPSLAARVWRWVWLSREADVPEVTGLLKPPPRPWETSDSEDGGWPRRHDRRCPNCGFAYNMAWEFAAVIPDKRRIIGGPNPMSRKECPVCAHVFRVRDGRWDGGLAIANRDGRADGGEEDKDG